LIFVVAIIAVTIAARRPAVTFIIFVAVAVAIVIVSFAAVFS